MELVNQEPRKANEIYRLSWHLIAALHSVNRSVFTTKSNAERLLGVAANSLGQRAYRDCFLLGLLYRRTSLHFAERMSHHSSFARVFATSSQCSYQRQ